MKRSWLVKARREHDITQAELSKRSGVAQGTISAIETGKTKDRISPKTAKKLALILEVDWQKFYE